MAKIVCWNIGRRKRPWHELMSMDADVALLQEAGDPPDDLHLPSRVELENDVPWAPWGEGHYDRLAMVVKLSDHVEIERFERVFPYSHPTRHQVATSGIGTVAIARIIPAAGNPFIAVSMYARWSMPQGSVKTRWRVGMPDIAAHRIISDLSMFIGDEDPSTHRILAAGDLNMSYRSEEVPPSSLQARERTVWDRMSALGMECLGPWHPAGRSADPPSKSPRNVITYHTTRQSPETARSQLDYVFASRGFHESVRVRALNGVNEWGSSDHCRLLIQVS